MIRHPGLIDHIVHELDLTLRTLCPPKHRSSARLNPAESIPDTELTTSEKRHIAGLMRVNHAGEVCAQALYQGQALTARLDSIKDQMTHAALEEIDHLAWCEERLHELDAKPSYLNPIWYSGSFFIGAFAGLLGDQWSLGFVAETERQVTAHIAHHLKQLPTQDEKTKAILSQMKIDETAHANTATHAGAHPLPQWIKQLMAGVSKLLTVSSYHL